MSKTRQTKQTHSAKKSKCINLLRECEEDGFSAIDAAIDEFNEGLLRMMMDTMGDELSNYIYPEAEPDTNALTIRLNSLMERLDTFEDPDCANFYLRLYKKRLLEITEKQLLTPSNKNPISLDTSINTFGIKDEYSAIDRAAIQLRNAMHNPALITEILRYLDKEFARYYLEKHGKAFPTLDKNDYDFKVVCFYEFPVPNKNFKHIDKHKALQEFLLQFLRKTADWAPSNKAVQWLGFIPQRYANNDLKNKFFIVEGGMNEGLFHGTLTHMLHLAIISVLIRNNILKDVTLGDVVNHLVNARVFDESNNGLLWQNILDQISFKFNMLGDPFLLHSFIMKHGHGALKTPALADSLIDTFCKKLDILANAHIKPQSRKLSEEITTFFRTMIIADFENKNLAKIKADTKTTAAYITENQQKGKKVLSTNRIKPSYARIQKEYHPNDNFIPQECRLDSELILAGKNRQLNSAYKYANSNRWHFFSANYKGKNGDAAKAAILNDLGNELNVITTEDELQQFERKMAFDKRFKKLQTGQGVTTRFLNLFWHLKRTTSEKTLTNMIREKKFLVL